MKDYMIWLIGGQSICGTMTEQEEFTDTDGTIVVRLDQVQAIAVSEPEGCNKAGF